MTNHKLQILVTNDDGYNTKGINILAEILTSYGNVTILAPKDPQSGKSTSLTLDAPLRLTEISKKKSANGNIINIWALTGTPTDCVKMAMNTIFKETLPNILVSGINHGSNASVASVYSGTLGATAEGTIYGIPSIGLSIDNHDHNADLSAIVKYAPQILDKFIASPPVKGDYLNVNFPSIAIEKIKGIRFAAQGNGMWVNEFTKYKDPSGRDYYWMSGEFKDNEEREIGDHKLLKEGYITIVPHKVDTTDYAEMKELQGKWNI